MSSEEERASREARALERLQWGVWCRVAQAWLSEAGSSRRFEIRLDSDGGNWLYLGGAQFGKRSLSAIYPFLEICDAVRLSSLLGDDGKRLRDYLEAESTHILYELELFAG